MNQTTLAGLLRRLHATGPAGFEGLILGLIEDLTGYPLYLARSGDQSGRDMRSARDAGAVIAVECKRYGSATELDKTELVGKLTEAVTTVPHLDSWVLVASRAVSDQLYTSIERAARELRIEFCILSADGTPSTLDILCANGRDRVLGSLGNLDDAERNACRQSIDRIRGLPGYIQGLERLRAELQRSAGYEWWRKESHRWLAERSRTAQSSHAAFGQLLNVTAMEQAGRLIRRASADDALDRWYDQWNQNREGLAITGEEGDGKTWAVASWLLDRCRRNSAFPPVMWLGAGNISDRIPGWGLTEILAARFGKDIAYWSGYLARWLAREPTSSPTALLVLDGLNERHSQVFWREFLQSARTSEWRAHIAVVITTRTEHWRYYRGLASLGFKEWTLGPFDNEEFARALSASGLAAGDIPVEVRRLARKPRYFDLVVQHRSRLVDVGDVTVARLVYEDWRDRFERKILALDDVGFRDLLKALARRALNDERLLSQRDLADAFPLLADQQQILSELATGGILVQDGERLSVEPNRLQLGLGLLLAERLRVAATTGQGDRLKEVAAEWLDGLPDTELRAGLCEAAVLHALKTADFSSVERAVLLEAWLRARNVAKNISPNVSAYFPLDPQAYFLAAESVWTEPGDDPAAQRMLMGTFRRWSVAPQHRDVLVGALERWLGFVHVNGSPSGISPEDRPKRRQALIERLNRDLQPGPFNFDGFAFTAIDDDGLLRLGRVALSLISSLDRRGFMNALVTGVLAEAIHAYPEKYDLFSWVVRTSPIDLGEDINRAARALIACGSLPALQAAHRLLSFEGSATSIALQASLPEDIFPPNRILDEYKRDPCASGFAWKREHAADCAAREDINLYHLAQQLERFCADKSFSMPAIAVQRLTDAAASMDVSGIHLGPGQTEADLRLEHLEPPLCAAAPTAAADIYRRLAREVNVRAGQSLRLLLHFLTEHILVLGSRERDVLRERWSQLRNGVLEDEADRHNESMLVRLMFSWMDGSDQLAALLTRSQHDDILVATDRWISPTPQDELLSALENSSEDTLQRVAYFISAQPQLAAGDLARRVVTLVTHSDSWTRASALRTVLRSGDELGANDVVVSDWHWQPGSRPDDNHFGSLLIARYGIDLPYEEVRARIEPSLLGFAVECRGLRADEVAAFATDIDVLWRQVLDQGPQPPPDFPQTEIHIHRLSNQMDAPARVGLARSEFSRGVVYRARASVWGGDDPQRSADVGRSFFGGVSDAEFADVQRRMSSALSEQREAGNIWFGRRFETAGLAAACAARPDLAGAWLAPVLNPEHPSHVRALLLARSFYESLCSVLLSTQPTVGVPLYFALKDARELTITNEALPQTVEHVVH
jgi:hypothetical protein